MKDYQRECLELCVEREVLRFGEFTLKSGRESPYFFNAGLFSTGQSLRALAGFYAEAIIDSQVEFDVLFGPAYKGIPLAAALATVFAADYGIDLPFAYDRKEAKDHGEGGVVVGAPLAGRVLVVDDVISAGTSIRHSADLIEAAGADFAGVAVALDRQERGVGDRAASKEIIDRYGVEVVSVLRLETLIEYLGQSKDTDAMRRKVVQYRAVYGPSR